MRETSSTKKTETSPKGKSPETASAASSDSNSSSDGSAVSSKSSREAVGGSSAVHYGFFSNIKSPEYKSGWDEIWGKKSNSHNKPAAKKSVQKTMRNKEPVVVSLSMAELPNRLQEELAGLARDRLKKSRISYDRRRKAGAVSWRIECEVKR